MATRGTAVDPGTASAEVRARVLDRHWRLLIGGELVAPLARRWVETIDPATEEVVARAPDAGAADVDRAVDAALAAYPGWRRTGPRERAGAIRRLAAVISDNAEELALLDALDGGFPIANMRNDVRWAMDVLELFADWALELRGATIPASAEHLHYTLREPYGVVGRIIPYNHPIFFAAAKIAAPLVAGNSVVLKPAEQTPLSALRLGELAAEVLPAGVLNVVAGRGPDSGRALVAHPQVRRLAFIGSDAVGRAIQRDAAAAGVKDVTLELGGKNAMLVLGDADVSKAAAGAVAGMNFVGSAGQSCGSNSRVLVHRDVVAAFTEEVSAALGALRIGSPLDEATQVGPLVSEAQRRRTEEYVAVGQSEGATLRHGGTRPASLERGFYFEPTMFADVKPEMRLAQEEVFGPVLAVLTYDSIDEAIQIANDVEYGLTASVWTSDVKTAHTLASALEAGYVWINGSSRHFWGMPFGGMKASGVGREESLEELLSFTQTKSVNVLLD
jgi:2-formylbenzoate dehydrogenase